MSATQEKIKVGVLRGGPSPEYNVSLQTGRNVLSQLSDRYHVKDIFIDKSGVWHHHGIQRAPHIILRHVDVVFNALHGTYGEDGKVQKILEYFGVPYTGSNSLASAIAMNKHLSKKVFRQHGLQTSPHEVIRKDMLSHSRLFGVYANLIKPLVVKPTTAGSSIGVSIVVEWDEFTKAVEKAFEFSDTVLVEEFVEGREATCGVIDSAQRKGHVYALLPIEIVKPIERNFFDYDSKYTGISQEICPGNFSEEEMKMIQDIAIRAHLLYS